MRKILHNIKRLFREDRKKAVIILLLLIMFLSFTAAVVLNLPKKTKAAWFDDAFLYRQKSTITNSGSAQTDFQISFVMNTSTLISAGKMQSDCDDIRVTDASGALLPHWIEENNPGCNSTTTKIWTKLASIPTTSQVIYIYYGNSSAVNMESGDRVFMFFDGFNSTSLAKWLELNTGTATISTSGGKLNLSTSTVSSTATVYSKDPATPGSTTFILEEKLNFTGSTGVNIRDRNYLCSGSITASGCTKASTFDYGAFSDSTGPQPQAYWNAFTGTSITTAHEIKVAQTLDGTNFTWSLTDLSDNSSIYSNSTAQASTSFNYVFLGATRDGSGTGTSQIAVDWVITRKYAATPPSAATTGSEEQSQGPVAYWKFDEGSDNTCSGGTNDICNSSYNSNLDGIVSGATWQSEDMCLSGKCLYFDGTNDYAEVADNDILDFGSNGFTVSTWIRTSNTSSQYLLEKDTSGCTNASWLMNTGALTGGAAYAIIGSTSSSCAAETLDDGTLSIADGKWHQMVIVRNPGGTNYIYVDGRVYDSIADPGGSTTNSQKLTIGAQNNDSDTRSGWFKGFMDEVKIYNYSRSAAQVKSDYDSRGVSKGASAVLGANAQNISALSDGLAGYWKLDEASGNATDSSGNGNTLTDTNTVARTTGVFQNSGDFEKDNSEYLFVADNSALSITGDLTVAAWIKRESSVDGYFLNKSDSLNRDSYLFSIVSDKLRLTLVDSSDVSSSTDSTASISTGTWYHVVGVYNQSTREVRLYINGQLADSATSGTVPSALEDNDGRFHLGATGSSGTPVGYYDGLLDEARVYNRALSNTEVSNLYNWAPGPVAYWKLDENTGSTIYDSSGNGNTATSALTGNTIYAKGKFGSGLFFDGNDDVARIPESTSTDIGLLTDSYTVSVWALSTASTITGSPFAKQTGSTYPFRIVPANANTSYGFNIRCGDSGVTVSSTTNYTSGWHYITGVRNVETDTLYLYIDGILITSANDTSPGSCQNNDDYSIGNANTASYNGNDFTGVVDEAKVYRYARTAKQIVEDMNASHPSGGSPVASQVSYWNLDEQQGQTANDKGFGANNGTLGTSSSASTDDPTWKTGNSSSCKVNGCLSFDGGDYITVGNVDELETKLNQGFSISTWAKSSDWVDAGPEMLVAKYAGDADGDFYLGVYQNKARALIDGLNGGVTGKVTNSTTNLTNGAWTHLAMTWSGGASDPILLYVNGKLDMTIESNNTLASIANSTEPIFIGARRNSAKEAFFNGQIDEVKVYNGALTASEVLLDYNAGSAIAAGGVLGTQDDEGFSRPSYKGTWSMNENKDNTCTNGTDDVCDRSGNGFDGAITGASWQPGKVGSALSFDGVDDNVSLPSISVPNNTDFTISLWAKIDSSQAGSVITLFGGCTDPSASPICTGADYDGILLRKDASDKLFLSTYFFRSGANSCAFVSTNTVPLGQWVHLAATFDENDASSVGTLYINGYKETLVSSDCTGMTSAATTLYPAIGALKESNNGASITYAGFTKGLIDNVNFYFDDLTQAQIAYDYNSGAPVALYKLDECQGATAYNSAPAGTGLAAGMNGTITPGSGTFTSTGTCNSGTSTEMWNNGTTGKYNSSLAFDGDDDYVTMADDAKLDVEDSQDFTITGWFKADDFGAAATLVAKKTGNGGGAAGYLINITTGAKLNAYVADGSGDGDSNDQFFRPGATTLSAGTWYHFAFVFDEDSAVNSIFYLNGKADDGPVNGTISDVASAANGQVFVIGAESDFGSPFDGQIDDVRFYNYALSGDQVRKVMNSGAVFFGPSTGTP